LFIFHFEYGDNGASPQLSFIPERKGWVHKNTTSCSWFTFQRWVVQKKVRSNRNFNGQPKNPKNTVKLFFSQHLVPFGTWRKNTKVDKNEGDALLPANF
jgi:hypothetical protein